MKLLLKASLKLLVRCFDLQIINSAEQQRNIFGESHKQIHSTVLRINLK